MFFVFLVVNKFCAVCIRMQNEITFFLIFKIYWGCSLGTEIVFYSKEILSNIQGFEGVHGFSLLPFIYRTIEEDIHWQIKVNAPA